MIGDLLNLFDPAIVHASEEVHVFQFSEATMLQEKLRTFFRRFQPPYDQRIQRDLALTWATLPGIRQLLEWNDLQHLAIADAIEIQTGYGVYPELKVEPHDKLKVVFHEPELQQFGIREIVPDCLGRMGEEELVFDRFCHNG